MGIAVLLAIIFAGIEDKPFGYTPELGEPKATLFPVKGTTFVQGEYQSFLAHTPQLIFLHRDVCLPEHHLHFRRPGDYPIGVYMRVISVELLLTKLR